jgi:HEAT repeat protein
MTIRRFGLMALLLCLFVIDGCSDDSRKAADVEKTTNETRHRTERIISVATDPVEDALRILGLSAADLAGPQYLEAGYRLAGRLPLIDHVARSPFLLQHWADDTSQKLQQQAGKSLYDITALTVALMNGGVSYDTEISKPRNTARNLAETYRLLCRNAGISEDPSVFEAIDQAGFTETFEFQLANLLTVMNRASQLVDKAYRGLTAEEKRQLSSRPERYFFPTDNHFNFLTAPTHAADNIIALAGKIDFISLYQGVLLLVQGIDEFSGFLRRLNTTRSPSPFFNHGTARDGRVLTLPTPMGIVVIAGQGDDIHKDSAALIIDLGGNDRYAGSAAAASDTGYKVSLTIDLSGNDEYDNGDRRYAQGFGCLSVGMLIDLSGNDRYRAGNMAQGCGIYGVGILADTEGDDRYEMGLLGQGFGAFGIGLLIDGRGNDRYIINGMGQGAGSTMGFGGLVDRQGNDKYLADTRRRRGLLVPDRWAHAQGAGLSVRSPDWVNHVSYYGGIGFLSDGEGRDFYFANEGNCMGSSYFMSLGALVDHRGSDTYTAQNGYGIGFAVHLSNGILIDRGGDDRYFGKIYTGGVGSDRSIGMLVDYAGDDMYGPSDLGGGEDVANKAETSETLISGSGVNQQDDQNMSGLSFGAAIKPKALGFLIDYQGDDKYYANPMEKRESCGGVVPNEMPDAWSHGLLLDLNGRDFYSKQDRKDNYYHLYLDHGLTYDTQYEGEAISQWEKAIPIPHRGRPDGSPRAQESHLQHLFERLHDPDLFVRHLVIGELVERGDSVVSDLMRWLKISSDNELNRDIIEILNRIGFSLNSKPEWTNLYEDLLQAPDPFVQIYAVRTLGYGRVETARPALIRAAVEADDALRWNLIWAIGQVSTLRNIAPLLEVATGNASLRCRRAALEALVSILENSENSAGREEHDLARLLTQSLLDSDETVRFFAARGLRHFFQLDSARAGLRAALLDNSVYVRRAAARSLIPNNEKAAIPVLIESLQFPSIDTFEFYDREIEKDLAFYCGIDFPSDERFEHATWEKWWAANGSTVNLKENIKIMHRIDIAMAAPNEREGMKIFDQLTEDHPGNIVIKNRYLRFCYEWITFRLLTLPQQGESVFRRCLHLQKKVVELEPDKAQNWERLAFYYARLGRYRDSIEITETALKINPHDNTLKASLQQYKLLNRQ